MPGRTVAAAAERASVHRPERSSIALVAVAVTLGFASWQLLASLGDAVSDVLLDWWEGEDTIRGIGAEFSIGSVDVEYGQVLTAALTLLLTLLVAVVLVRLAAPQDGPRD